MPSRMALALVVVAALGVGGWLLSRRGPARPTPEAKAPLALTAPDAAVVIALAPLASGAPPLPTDIAVKEPVGFDAGETMEVTLEVFDEKGHVAGGTIVLKNPPCPPDGGRGVGAVEVEARTNVMGFARVALVPGTWEVENFKSAPGRIDVGWGQNAFVLRKSEWVPATIEGTVVDADGGAVEGAQVTAEAWSAPPPRPHAPPALQPSAVSDARGHFVVRTFDRDLLLVVHEGIRTAGPKRVAANTTGTTFELRP